MRNSHLALTPPCSVCRRVRACAHTHTDTILSWSEPETGVDFALSFQEPDGCTEVWEQICAIQGRTKDEQYANDPNAECGQPMGANSGAAGAFAGPSRPPPQSELLTLPACELRNLCLLYTSPSPRDGLLSRMPSSA